MPKILNKSRMLFDEVLTSEGWLQDVLVEASFEGKVVSLIPNYRSKGGEPYERIKGWLIPGFSSSHSHSFQYAMAGMSEFRSPVSFNDSFWSWRETMYNLANMLTPDQIFHISATLFSELLRNGYTEVVEFHYLHNNRDGAPYSDPLEIAKRIISAADYSGINLTLVPVFYKNGDFDAPASASQKRFLFRSTDQYFSYISDIKTAYPQKNIGTGVHSLRVATPKELIEILNNPTSTFIHLHIAEQKREVEKCLATFGKRPVDWLLKYIDVSRRHSLVHATHATSDEIKALAHTGATVVICPSTEANLGDGYFRFEEFRNAGGIWAIGSDSQICLNPLEELRWIDYQVRLQKHIRNPFCKTSNDFSGSILFSEAWLGGQQASGRNSDDRVGIEVGKQLTGIVLDPDHPLLAEKQKEARMSALIYAGDSSCYRGVLVNSDWIIKGGKHNKNAKLTRDFRSTIREIFKSD